jgi:DNA-binding response OmpR family regulator
LSPTLSLASARILLIDDDRKLARLLVELLRANGYSATAVHDGVAGLERAREEPWDLIVLDVMLPHLDGFELLKRLRLASGVPVLMLTARGAEADLIGGLEGGADDYVPKTASSRELLARIKALLRRAALGRTGKATLRETIVVAGLRLDVDARAAFLDAQSLNLTAVEFDLLLTLARAKGSVRTREQLLLHVREREFDAADRSIDVHIAALRRKLADDPRTPRFIRTMRGVGYMLVDPADPL